MARLDFAQSAIADTREILSALVERAGRPVAVAYFERFSATFDRIATFPDSGAPRPSLGITVRLAVVHPYVDLSTLARRRGGHASPPRSSQHHAPTAPATIVVAYFSLTGVREAADCSLRGHGCGGVAADMRIELHAARKASGSRCRRAQPRNLANCCCTARRSAGVAVGYDNNGLGANYFTGVDNDTRFYTAGIMYETSPWHQELP